MSAALRPLSFGELLDRTFSLYRKNFVLFLGVCILPAGMILILSLVQVFTQKANSLLMPGSNIDLSLRGIAVPAIFVILTLVTYFIGTAISQSAAVRAVSAVHLEQPMTIAEAFTNLRFGRVLRVVLTVLIRVFSPAFLIFLAAVILIPGLVRSRANPLAAAGFAVVFLALWCAALVWMVFISIKYAFGVPACVVEDIGAVDSLKRSRALTRDSRGRIFILFILAFVLALAVALGLRAPVGFLAALFNHNLRTGRSFVLTKDVLEQVAQFMSSALVAPVGTVATCLLYYDARVRKEAFDIEHMMKESGLDHEDRNLGPAAPESTAG